MNFILKNKECQFRKNFFQKIKKINSIKLYY
jgi:hypothetical protein